jgi:hypothetical protein
LPAGVVAIALIDPHELLVTSALSRTDNRSATLASFVQVARSAFDDKPPRANGRRERRMM